MNDTPDKHPIECDLDEDCTCEATSAPLITVDKEGYRLCIMLVAGAIAFVSEPSGTPTSIRFFGPKEARQIAAQLLVIADRADPPSPRR